MLNNELKVEEIIHGPYKDFAKYVLENRAIPNVIDGLKSSQRKALWTATQAAKSKFIKIAALTGHAISSSNYHHGDDSMNKAISLMGSEWANNAALLEGDGNFGSRIVPEPSAPRYIYVRLAKTFDKFFKDNDVLNSNIDPESPEPQFYLPIIPWILVNGISGIAVGHACDFQPHNPKDLAKAVTEYIKTGKIKTKLTPWIENFQGDIKYDKTLEKFISYGKYTLKGRVLTITELHYGINRENYIKKLDKLDTHPDSPFISYVDRSQDEFCFEVKLKNGVKLTHDEIIKKFSLSCSLKENMTAIDENGKLIIFDNVNQVIEHFVDYRMTKYVERYEHYIERDQAELDKLSYKLRFIKAVVDGKINLKNRSKDDIKVAIQLLKIPDEYSSMCLNIRIHSFCDDEINSLTAEIKALEDNIKTWENIDHKKEWISELKEIS